MSKWVELKFKDVPVGSEFGYKDYFMYKSDVHQATFSGEDHEFGPDVMVVMEVVVDE